MQPHQQPLSIHDPILDSTPRLRSLKRQLPVAVAVFVVGLLVGMGGLFWAVPRENVLAIVAAALVTIVAIGYFVYVTVSLSVLAKRARYAQIEEQLASVAQQADGQAAEHVRQALEAVRRAKR